jgi:ankyrin repeat protein
MCGKYAVARLLVQEFKFNVNQRTTHRNVNTPLCTVLAPCRFPDAQRLEMVRVLLENGAKVNQHGLFNDIPLTLTVKANNADLVHLLLVEYRAKPTSQDNRFPGRSYTNDAGTAVLYGNAEILRMLLDHDATLSLFEPSFSSYGLERRTSLYALLDKVHKTRATKLTICQILCEHAKKNATTAAVMRLTLETAMKQAAATTAAAAATTDNNNINKDAEYCQILLESGMDSRTSLYCAIRAENLAFCQQLVQQVNDGAADPFLQNDNDEDNDESNDVACDDSFSSYITPAASSPFVAAARLSDTAIFEYLLTVWNERFAVSNGGKNGDGDYPIHVVCCDPLVSLQALLVPSSLLLPQARRPPKRLVVVDLLPPLLPPPTTTLARMVHARKKPRRADV